MDEEIQRLTDIIVKHSVEQKICEDKCDDAGAIWHEKVISKLRGMVADVEAKKIAIKREKDDDR